MTATVNRSWKCIFFLRYYSLAEEITLAALFGPFDYILPAKGPYMIQSFCTRAKINMNRSVSVTGPLCVLCPPPLFARAEITSQLGAESRVYVNKSLFHDPFMLWTGERLWFIISVLWIISLKP